MDLLCNDDRRRIDAHLAAVLDRVFGPGPLEPLCGAVREYVLAGGKRLRPQLCLWTYRHAAPAAPEQAGVAVVFPPALLDVACVWEMFHAFLLAHDDVMDGADTRRGRPSLHRRLAAAGGPPRLGQNLAIVAGDLLFGACMAALHDADLPPRAYRGVLRLFSRVACTTGFGQAIDLCHSHAPLAGVREQTLRRGYEGKTAAYTFEGPMLSGAIAAGVDDPAALAALSRFALSIGQAYQVHNDLLDLAAPAHGGCDLVQGKRTITLMRARRSMDETRRRRFDDDVESLRTKVNGEAVLLAESLRQQLHVTGAVDDTRELIADFLTEARSAASSPALGSLGAAMRAMLDTIEATYFLPRPPACPLPGVEEFSEPVPATGTTALIPRPA